MPAKIFFGLALMIVLACGACAKGEGQDVPALAAPLALTAWPPAEQPKAVVVAVHGRNRDHSAFAAPAALWAKRGILTYAYDQRPLMAATGSFGVAALAEDLRCVIGWAHYRNPEVPLFVLGDSMGASVAILALADPRAFPVAGIVLSAPAIWPVPESAAATEYLLTVTANFFNSSALRSWAGLIAIMEAAPTQAPALAGQPVLVLYGERDGLVPKDGVDRLMRVLGEGAQYRSFSDADHRMFNFPAVSELVGDWISAAAAARATSAIVVDYALFHRHDLENPCLWRIQP